MTSHQQYLICLGGNLPLSDCAPDVTLKTSLLCLKKQGVSVEAVSRFFSTPCFPAGSGPDYINAAAQIAFSGGAGEILAILHEVEHEFGRERQERWGGRTLDLDLIAGGQLILPDVEIYRQWRDLSVEQQMRQSPDQLILPHPRVQDRAFALVPLADVAPDWMHPVLGKTVLQMLEELPEGACDEIRALPDL